MTAAGQHVVGLSAIVLAGGRSTRFGSDKASALIDGRPMLQRVVEAVAAVCDEVIVVAAAGGAGSLPPYAEPLVIVEDRVEGSGPLAGLAKFDDPTLALDPRALGQVKREVLALPNGQAILDSTLAAQREGVATAIDDIFLGSAIAAVVVVLLALTLPEIPLRRGFGAAALRQPSGQPAQGGPEPELSIEPLFSE
jgi:hypothetical protein